MLEIPPNRVSNFGGNNLEFFRNCTNVDITRRIFINFQIRKSANVFKENARNRLLGSWGALLERGGRYSRLWLNIDPSQRYLEKWNRQLTMFRGQNIFISSLYNKVLKVIHCFPSLFWKFYNQKFLPCKANFC